jgi:hypothetical protein
VAWPTQKHRVSSFHQHEWWFVGRKPYQLNLGQHQERWLISSPRLLRFLPRESWKSPTLKLRMGTQFWDMSNRNEDSLRSNVVTLHFWGLQWVKWCYFSALMLYKLYIYMVGKWDIHSGSFYPSNSAELSVVDVSGKESERRWFFWGVNGESWPCDEPRIYGSIGLHQQKPIGNWEMRWMNSRCVIG